MVGAESVYTAPVTLLSGCKFQDGTSMDGRVDFKSHWMYSCESCIENDTELLVHG